MSDFKYHKPSAFPPVVKNLIIINVLVYIAQIAFQSQFLTEKLTLYPIIPEELYQLAIQSGVITPAERFKPYQLITHMFTHAPPPNFSHILFNMFGLWMFGRVLENVWGPKRFLIFYLVCGIGAAAAHLTVQYFRSEQMLHEIYAAVRDNNRIDGDKFRAVLSGAIGASGAIMGVLAAFAYLFPNTELFMIPIPIPIKAKWFVLGYVLLDLFSGIGAVSGDNIAHFAHLGGAITGFIIVFIWNKTNRRTLY
jgi:membrane associated rhomboid family serine protease